MAYYTIFLGGRLFCGVAGEAGVEFFADGEEGFVGEGAIGITADDEGVGFAVEGFGKDETIAIVAAVNNDFVGGIKDGLDLAVDVVGHIGVVVDAVVDKIGFADVDLRGGGHPCKGSEITLREGRNFNGAARIRRKEFVTRGELGGVRRGKEFGLVGEPRFRDGAPPRCRDPQRNQ